MKINKIKPHLKAKSIFQRRKTTINYEFASAIAPNDKYDEQLIREAITTLGQNPDDDLNCVYCGNLAQSWDHVFGLVKDNKFSGYGHVIGNLVPCCKKCNSEKGNKNWLEFIATKPESKNRITILTKYFSKYLIKVVNYDDIKKDLPKEIIELEKIKEEIFKLMKRADEIASKIRKQIH